VKKYVISFEGKIDIIMSKKTHRYKQIFTLNPKTLVYLSKKLLKKIPFQRTKLFKNIYFKESSKCSLIWILNEF
jgi:hypothetical protein